MPYTTANDIAAHLGRTLTAAQMALAEQRAAEATAFVDRYCGRSFAATSPATAELHTVTGGLVYLTRRPVTAITSVTVRTSEIGATSTTLVAGATYELLDAANGVLRVSATDGALVSVTYAHGATAPPADIEYATTVIAAHWLMNNLHPQAAWLTRYAQGDVSLSFRDQDIPAEALVILKARRPAVMFA